MSITFPLTPSQFWERIRFSGRPEFDLLDYKSESMDGAGNVFPAKYGEPKWRADVATPGGRHNADIEIQALIKALKGRDTGRFLAYDIRRPYPLADPLGAKLAVGSLVAIDGEAAFGDVAGGVYRLEGGTLTQAQALSLVSDAGTRFNSSGVLVTETANTIRVDYDPVTLALRGILCEPATRNDIRNNTMVGAASGTPGTTPTNWSVVTASGIAINVVGTGQENGVDYIDFRIVGTATAGVSAAINFESTSQVVTATGETWTTSAFLKLVSGSLSTITSISAGIREALSGGTFVQDTIGANIKASITSTLTRFSQVSVVGGATSVRAMPKFYISIANGAVVDATIRIGLPQFEKRDTALRPIRTSGSAISRAADALTIKAHGTNDFTLTYDDASTGSFTGKVGNWTIVASGLARTRIKGWSAARKVQPGPGTIQVKSKGADNRSLSLKGMMANYGLSIGDRISISNGAGLYSLHELMEPVTSDLPGDTSEFEVQPFLPSWIAVGQVVSVVKPVGKFRIVSYSYKPQAGSGNISSGIGFSMITAP